MKNIMKRFFPLPLFAAVMFAATACVSEETIVTRPGTSPTGGDTEVLLRLRTPGSFAAPDTRALTFAQENAVNDVYVFAFDSDDELVAILKGRNPDFDPNGNYDGPDGTNNDTHSASGTFSVNMPESLNGTTVRLAVLANAGDILTARDFVSGGAPASGMLGQGYEDVKSAIYGELTEGGVGEITSSIPMWGETQITVSMSAKPTIELMRAIARLDIGIGKPKYTKGDAYPWSWDGKNPDDGTAISFVLTGIEVYKSLSQYSLIPDLDSSQAPELTSQSSALTTFTTASNISTTSMERTAWITIKAGRPSITVEVMQERILQPGVLAASGVIGYIKGTNQLTIRGSEEFAGSAVMENGGAGPNALAAGLPLENETVYVAYFKFDSLVATRSEHYYWDFELEDVVA